MIMRDSGFGMGVCRFSRLLRGVAVLAMLDAGLNTTRRIESVCEVPLCVGVPGVAVGVFIDRHCVSDGVRVTC